MAEYIEREAAITTYKTFGHLNLRNALEAFEQIPAADVRPVVLCRDCVFFETGKDYTPYCNHLCGMDAAFADGYCSCGERKHSN